MTTPVDPRDIKTLETIFTDAWRDEQSVRTERGRAGIAAVARAVCPEHYAVYDKRRFVAVNRVQLDILIEACIDQPATETTPETYHRLKTDVLIKGLRMWLPDESEAK